MQKKINNQERGNMTQKIRMNTELRNKLFNKIKDVFENEDTQERSDELGFWAMVKDAKLYNSYLASIKKVSSKDVKRVAKNYFTKDYTMAVIEQN